MSASRATTGSPRAARYRTNSDDSAVLPLPPLPANAIFTESPNWNDFRFHVRIAVTAKELEASDDEFTDNQVPPPDEAARGQLLRMMASDAMRGAIERLYGVRLAFQNCHRAAVFRPGATRALAEFTTARSQILNQRPELVDC